MSTKIDTAISPALHPDNVKSIDGYDDETAPVLAQTMTAFSAAYQAIGEVKAAREAGEKNQAWSPETLTIKLDDLATKKLNAITRTFDAEMTRLNKAITFLEGELSQPVQSQAVGSLGREIRDHVKALKPDQRQAFIQRAIDGGDHLSATAVLGAPAYLSGLEDQMGQALLRHYHAKHNPDKAKRLKALQGARSLIEANAGKAFTAMEKVVGAPPDKAKKLREANSAAEKHFAMHGS